MSRRATIYLSDAAEAALGPEAENLSGRINSMLIRYEGIRADACPTLTEAEWSAIVDVLNGTWLMAEHTDADPARHLWAEMADSPEMAEKWGIDIEELVITLRNQPYAARIAIVEVATRFWKSPNLNAASTSDLLREAGARIAPTSSRKLV
jgi:hypothetical protein